MSDVEGENKVSHHVCAEDLVDVSDAGSSASYFIDRLKCFGRISSDNTHFRYPTHPLRYCRINTGYQIEGFTYTQLRIDIKEWL